MKNIVAYCRTAYEDAEKPRDGVKRQAKAIGKYAKKQSFSLNEIYMDPEKSGVTLDRPALRKLLSECRAGKVSTVIAKHPDRLSRDINRLIRLMTEFRKTGVRVEFSTKEGRGYYESQQHYWKRLPALIPSNI